MLMAAFQIPVVVVGTFARLKILLLSPQAKLHLPAKEPGVLNLQPLGALQGVQLPLNGLGTQWIHCTWV